MQDDPICHFSIDAGDALHLPVAPGTVLLVAHGRARIDESPRWLAERMVPVGQTLGDGEACTVEHAGWVRVSALGGAGVRLRSIAAAEPAQWRAPWWRSLMRLLPGASPAP